MRLFEYVLGGVLIAVGVWRFVWPHLSNAQDDESGGWRTTGDGAILTIAGVMQIIGTHSPFWWVGLGIATVLILVIFPTDAQNWVRRGESRS